MFLINKKRKIKLEFNYCKYFIEKNIKDFYKFSPDLEERLNDLLNSDIILKNEGELLKELRFCVNNTKRKINSNSKLYWVGRGYSEKEAEIKVSDLQKLKSKRCIEYWISKGYSEEEAKNEVSKHQAKSFDIYKSKYDENEFEDILRENSPWSVKFWIKRGYTKEEALKEINKIQKKNASKIDYEKRKPTYLEKEYWMNRGYTEEESIKILKENSDTRSLSSHIKRYGESEGKKSYEEQINRFKNTVSNFSEEKKNLINHKRSVTMKEWIKTKPFQRQSKEGKMFCLKLYRKLRQDNIINKKSDFVCYTSGEKVLKEGDMNYYYDVCILDKYIVEFNGTPWHYDRKFEKELDWFWRNPHFFPGITKENTEKKDIRKKELAIRNDYKYYVVWDFQDLNTEIEKITAELKGGHENNHI